MKLAERCQRIRMLLCDVDGVMTDGAVILDGAGGEWKQFHIRDGLGVRLWQRAGGQFGIVTGRTSAAVAARAAELDIEHIRQGVSDKLPEVQSLASTLGIALEEIAYLGDDLPDAPVIRAVGLGAAVADAAEEVRATADYVASLRGGQGALREFVELILKNNGRWETVIADYME